MQSEIAHFGENQTREFRITFSFVAITHLLIIAAFWSLSLTREKTIPEKITWLDGGPIANPPPPSPPISIPESIPEKPASIEPPPQDPAPQKTIDPKPIQKTPVEKIIPKLKPSKPPRKNTASTKQKTQSSPSKSTQKTAPKIRKTQPDNNTKKGDAPSGSTTQNHAGSAHGSLTTSERSRYFSQVGACFRAVWNQPLTINSTGQELTAIVRIRVSADGSVLSSTMDRGTGNTEVDASIRTAFPKFKNVPPPPAALLDSGVMEENMAVIYTL